MEDKLQLSPRLLLAATTYWVSCICQSKFWPRSAHNRAAIHTCCCLAAQISLRALDTLSAEFFRQRYLLAPRYRPLSVLSMLWSSSDYPIRGGSKFCPGNSCMSAVSASVEWFVSPDQNGGLDESIHECTERVHLLAPYVVLHAGNTCTSSVGVTWHTSVRSQKLR